MNDFLHFLPQPTHTFTQLASNPLSARILSCSFGEKLAKLQDKNNPGRFEAIHTLFLFNQGATIT